MAYLYIHINNDFSGSPYAMRAIIRSHNQKDFKLMTSHQNNGFLSDFTHEKIINVGYKFHGKNFKTILSLSKYFFISFLKSFLFNNRFDTFYINTIMPWTAAVAGKLRKKKIIYHIHEFYYYPGMQSKFYIFIISKIADEIIYVSKYVQQEYHKKYPSFTKIPSKVKFTPIRFKTISSNKLFLKNKFEGPIIMICSPKKYKGIPMFAEIAKYFSSLNFILYISEPLEFKLENEKNMKIIVGKSNLIMDYRNASICLNLSQNPDWIETFGLTIWESLSQGTPVIAPNIGGPVELLNNEGGINCDTTSKQKIINSIKKILTNYKIYSDFCSKAVDRSKFLETTNKIDEIK